MATSAAIGNAAEQQPLADRARASLTPETLGDLCLAMTSIASPTGEERELADYLANRLADAGLDTHVVPFAERGASVVARLGDGREGPNVWVYAPLDSAFAGNAAEDRPFLGLEPRPDFALPPRREGGKIIGMAADNPKGFAAAAVAAFESLSRAGLKPRGSLVLTLAGGSMPVGARPGMGTDIGFGAGIKSILAGEPKPDFAVVLKPGYAAGTEEVGLAWFKITVRGAINYTGIRHKGQYRNPIVIAARLITRFEEWLPEFTAATGNELVAPQGSINSISAGSPDRASFIPETCELVLDLRLAPDTSADDAQRGLESFLERAKEADPELRWTLERLADIPGTRTPVDAWIVRLLIRAWEAQEGKQHEPVGRGSGASDMALIRHAGIPAARMGMPMPRTPSPFPGFSMGVADEESMYRLATLLVGALSEAAALTRSEEVGQARG